MRPMLQQVLRCIGYGYLSLTLLCGACIAQAQAVAPAGVLRWQGPDTLQLGRPFTLRLVGLAGLRPQALKPDTAGVQGAFEVLALEMGRDTYALKLRSWRIDSLQTLQLALIYPEGSTGPQPPSYPMRYQPVQGDDWAARAYRYDPSLLPVRLPLRADRLALLLGGIIALLGLTYFWLRKPLLRWYEALQRRRHLRRYAQELALLGQRPPTAEAMQRLAAVWYDAWRYAGSRSTRPPDRLLAPDALSLREWHSYLQAQPLGGWTQSWLACLQAQYQVCYQQQALAPERWLQLLALTQEALPELMPPTPSASDAPAG